MELNTSASAPQEQNHQNHLATLPTEIIEKIAENLDLPDLSNLRLTCRDMSRRATGPQMKSHFHAQTTDLSSSSLARLVAITSNPTFGPAVKRLTVLATVYFADWLDKMAGPALNMTRIVGSYSENQIEEFPQDLEFISDRRAEQSLAELEAHVSVIEQLTVIMKNLGHLDSVNLVGVVVTSRDQMCSPARAAPKLWHNVARRAAQAFYVTMEAMVRSGLQTPVFQVFPTTRRCSIPAGCVSWLLSVMDVEPLGTALSPLKNFSLSFAPISGTRNEIGLGPGRAGGQGGGHEGEDGPEAAALEEETFQALPALLGLMPQLEILDLHMYNPFRRRSVGYSNIFVNMARDVQFPKLQKCILRGIWGTEESLLQFLEKHASQIEHLELRDFWLTEGTWAPVFRQLNTKQMPNLEFLRLENLFYGENKLVNLAPRNPEPINDRQTAEVSSIISFPCTGGHCVFLREFGPVVLNRGLEFSAEDRGRLLPSPEFKRWKMNRGDEFGPPPEAREYEEVVNILAPVASINGG